MKNLFYWLLTGCFLLNIAACSDNENIPEEEPIPWGGDEGPKPGHIWSVPSIEFMFQVLDKDGRDLLNPNTPGSYAGAKITATFRATTALLEKWRRLRRLPPCKAKSAQAHRFY